jgi:predicted phage baseplate assembly protein
MSLPAPNLDDRKFQDIVSEARSKIPLYCPKWTDYNLSDPGVTLIELFAWMVDMMLYRLNKVPDKNYIKFMELMGIRLQPPNPALVNVTFRLSAPQPDTVLIPSGTEVATVRTETQDAVIFSTREDAQILVPALDGALTTFDGVNFFDIMGDIKNPYREKIIFPDLTQPDNALYLSYKEDLRAHALALTIQTNIEGIGVDPSNPPWTWEYWDKERQKWLSLRIERDTTGGFNTSGQIILHIPVSGGKREINGKHAFWIRCRATQPRPGQGEYNRSPIVRTILSESVGYTVPASQGARIKREFLGQSDGSPSQVFQIQNIPILKRTSGETIEIETEIEDEYKSWQEVDSFINSKPDDFHYTCDSVSGEIRFGPSIRQTSGDERQFGKIPPSGRRIRFCSYRTGGGTIGNVGKGTITIIKSSIPYLASVTNFEAASGGTDAETLENAKLRAPGSIMASSRAVTQEDYENMAFEASSDIARVKCLTNSIENMNLPPATVRLLVVPSVLHKSGYINPDDLQLLPETKNEIQVYLDKRRLLATRLEITVPEYVWVSSRIQVKGRSGINSQQVIEKAESKLCSYINPIIGGSDGNGWPFGRSLSLSDVYLALQTVLEIEYVKDVQLFCVKKGQLPETNSVINIPFNALPCSFKHEFIVI